MSQVTNVLASPAPVWRAKKIVEFVRACMRVCFPVELVCWKHISAWVVAFEETELSVLQQRRD